MNSTFITLFDVDESNLLTDTSIPEPKTRAEVFERIDLSDAHDADSLIELIQLCQPLADHFRRMSIEYLEDISNASDFLRDLSAEATARTGAQRLIMRALQEDPEEGWQQWIEYSSDSNLETFREIVRNWLEEDVDWREHNHFDSVWNGQTAAFGFFQNLPRSTLIELGVQLIDGGRPGSQLAMLTKNQAHTNELAQHLGLTCRFRAASVTVAGAKHD
jgi:hypothetical protein